MEDLLNLIEERNTRETYPFESIHASYDDLWQDVDTWQKKCEELERKVVSQQEELNNLIYDQHHHGRIMILIILIPIPVRMGMEQQQQQ